MAIHEKGLTDYVKVLHPTWHKSTPFRTFLPANHLHDAKQMKPDRTEETHAPLDQKILYHKINMRN